MQACISAHERLQANLVAAGSSCSRSSAATGAAPAGTAPRTASAAARHIHTTHPPTAHGPCRWPTAHATAACTYVWHVPPNWTNLGWGCHSPNAPWAHQAGGWGPPARPNTDAASALATAEVCIACAWWAHTCPADAPATARSHAAGGHATGTRYARGLTMSLIILLMNYNLSSSPSP